METRLSSIVFEENEWAFKLSDGYSHSNQDSDEIPIMDNVKRIILDEENVPFAGFKLIGMQLFSKSSELIDSFGIEKVSGTKKVITLEDNEFLFGVKARKTIVQKHIELYNVQLKIIQISKSTVDDEESV